MLKGTLRDISSHSFFYSLAWIASSAASIVLLPVYTKYLSRSDYGILEILDYTNIFLTIIVTAGLGAAIPKFFSAAKDDEEKKRVLSTSATFVIIAAGVICLFTFFESEELSRIILGRKEYQPFINLNILLLFSQLTAFVSGMNFIARKQSKIYLSYMLLRMVISISFNLYFIIVKEWGVYGMLYGNIIGNSILAVVITSHSVMRNGFRIDLRILGALLKFGTPLVPATLLATIMHNADKYLIRYYCSLEDVGIYALGFKFPFMLNALLLQSFNFIWTGATIYEIEKKPNASYEFGRITTYVMAFYIIAQTTLSVYSDVIIKIFAHPKFYVAHQVVPLIALGLCFHAFYFFFSVGTLLKKKTWLVNIAFFPAALISIGGNVILLPRYGYLASAWMVIATYGIFAVILYFSCKNLIKVEYEFKRIAWLFAGGILTYFLSSRWEFENLLGEVIKGTLFILLFLGGLFIFGWFHKGELDEIRRKFKIDELLWLLRGRAEFRRLFFPKSSEDRSGGGFSLIQELYKLGETFIRHVVFRKEAKTKEGAGLPRTAVKGEIGDWMNALYPQRVNWVFEKCERYPYSEVYILSQTEDKGIPKRVAIKKFKTNFEDPKNTSWEKLRKESEALYRVEPINGLFGVTTPRVIGLEKNLVCLATDFVEGARLVNYLLKDPIRVRGLIEGKAGYEEQICNLGKWLRAMHEIDRPKTGNGEGLRQILARDLQGIEMRVAEMGGRKKNDFPMEIRERILKDAHALAEGIIAENAGLRTIHGDFSLANILYRPALTAVVDFASFGEGFAEDDLARIYLDFHNVGEFTFLLHPNLRRVFQNQFFTGYGRSMEINGSPADRFYLLKHGLINVYMYSLKWDENRQFLNPFLCRILYTIQKRFLYKLIGEGKNGKSSIQQ